MRIIPIPSDSNVSSLGQGYRTVLRHGESSPFDPEHLYTQMLASNTVDGIVRCLDKSAVYGALGIGLNADVQYGGVGFSEILDFASSATHYQYCVNVIAYKRKIRVDRVVIANFNQPFGDARELYRAHGDSYISMVKKTQMYAAAFTFICDSEEQKMKVNNIVETYIDDLGDNASAKLGTMAQTVVTQTKSTLRFRQRLFGAEMAMPVDKDDIGNFLDSFATMDTSDDGYMLGFQTTRYSDVRDAPNKNGALDAIEENTQKFIEKYKRWFSGFPIVLNNIDSVSKLYNFYRQSKCLSNLYDQRSKLDEFAVRLQDWANRVDSDPVNINGASGPGSEHGLLRTPFAQYDFIYGNLSGLSTLDGGFQDVAKSDVYLGIHLVSMGISWGGSWINHLAVKYDLMEPLETPIRYVRGDLGNQDIPDNTNDFMIGMDAPLTTVRTYTAQNPNYNTSSCLCTIKVTNSNRNSFNFGVEMPSNAASPQITPQNSVLIGWAGHALDILLAIQPLYAQFSDPIWMNLY